MVDAKGMIGLSLVFGTLSPVYAFGNAYEVLDPKTAVMNDETYKSDAVKESYAGLKTLTTTVQGFEASLTSDTQFDLRSKLPTDLNPSTVRDLLNSVSAI